MTDEQDNSEVAKAAPMSAVLRESLQKQIAVLTIQGVPEYKIAESLNISRHRVRTVRKSKEFKAEILSIGEAATAIALNMFKAKMEELEPLAYAALKQNLQEGKLEAVKVWGDFVGVKDKQEKTEQGGNMVIVMPGAKAETTVESEVIDVTEDKE